MTRRALTDRLVQSLTSEGKSQFEHYDGFCPGLLLRVSSGGGKVWDLTFKSPTDGKRARLRIGRYPVVGLAKARDKAVSALAKISQGQDPRTVIVEAAPKTIAELIEDRMALHLRANARSVKDIEGRANKYITPKVGAVRVTDFRIDPHYNSVVDPLILRGKMRTAGLLYQDLRALMNFGIQRGVIEFSRLQRIKRPDTPVYRTRFLNRNEIVTVWNLLPTALSRSPHIPRILRLCIVTLQRLSEVAGMRRSEIDLERRLWVIPARRSKNKHEHTVPLSGLALELIGEAMRKTNGDILFPNRAGDAPIKHRAIDCALRLAQNPRKGLPSGKFGVPIWKPHDLRRTGGTHLSLRENDLMVSVIDRAHVLNHRSVTRSSITDTAWFRLKPSPAPSLSCRQQRAAPDQGPWRNGQ
jgi:integrase